MPRQPCTQQNLDKNKPEDTIGMDNNGLTYETITANNENMFQRCVHRRNVSCFAFCNEDAAEFESLI